MTRSDLIAELAATRPQLRVADIELIVATIFDRITGALARGDRVELRGFGAFSVKQRGARIGLNPRTGETVRVGEKAVPYFKTGKEMRDRLIGADLTTPRGIWSMLHASPPKPRPPTWKEVMSALEDAHDTLCRALLLPRIPLRARADLRALLTDRVRPLLEREGRRHRAIPAPSDEQELVLPFAPRAWQRPLIERGPPPPPAKNPPSPVSAEPGPERARPGLPRNTPRRLRHLSPEQLSDYRLFQRKGFRAAEALAIVTAERPQPLPGNALADAVAAAAPSASADPT